MPEPFSIAGAIVKMAGPTVGRELNKWRKGSEARQLAMALKGKHAAAEKMLTQPGVIGELWKYAETGDLDEEALLREIRAITDSEDEAVALVAAVKTTQWRVVRDDRRIHFDLLRMQSEMRTERQTEQDAMLTRVATMIDTVRARLPVARQLPAEVDEFVDRTSELEKAEMALATPRAGQSAVVLACSGMAGMGKSALAVRIAHRHAERFAGGILHIDMRDASGTARPTATVATQLLRDLGVDAGSISSQADRAPALLRSVLADSPTLIVLDNAENEAHVRDLIPASRGSVVIITSRQPLGGLGGAHLLAVEELAEADATELLHAFLGDRVDAELAAARTIARACHGMPLALTVVAARLRRTPHRPLGEIADGLARGANPLDVLDDAEAALTSALRSGIEALSTDAARLLMLVAALDVAELDAPLAAALVGCPDVRARRLIEELDVCRLIRLVPGGSFRVHDLVRAAARMRAKEVLDDDDLASGQQRRVDWLVETGATHIDDLGEGT